MRILGLGGLDHNGAAAIVEDGQVVAFLEAERVTRRKNIGLEDGATLTALLDALGVEHVDAVAVADQTFWRERSAILAPEIRARFGDVPLHDWPHHDCHTQAAMVASPWETALCISVDGKGDGKSATAVLSDRTGPRQRLLDVSSAHSLGRLWWAVSEYCGLPGHHSAGKTMALAAYGRPRPIFEPHVELEDDGGFRLSPRELHPDTFRQVPRIVTWLASAFDQAPGALHADAAATLQRLTERVLAHLVASTARRSGSRRVCLAGGVALNGLANQALLDAGVTDDLYVPPCADDRGLALGAAALLSGRMGESVKARAAGLDPFLGPLPASSPPKGWVQEPTGVEGLAERLEHGQVLAWFSGRDEAGPRALGHRSILATPTFPWMRDHLNREIKRREVFRPFGCSIKLERADDWLDARGPSPYMARIARVRPDRVAQVPAVVHVDGTSRLQTVARDDSSGLWTVLDALEQRGHPPLLVNTSLNGPREPLVSSVSEAAEAAARLGIGVLVIDGVAHVRAG